MRPTSASPCITTERLAETREFYRTNFDASITFDCGWYVSIALADGVSLQFMQPQPGQPACATAGLTYNFCVADVDEEHRRLAAKGLHPVMPIEDHPWGDRGFAVRDPNGVTLYIYSEREPAAEFKPYYS